MWPTEILAGPGGGAGRPMSGGMSQGKQNLRQMQEGRERQVRERVQKQEHKLQQQVGQPVGDGIKQQQRQEQQIRQRVNEAQGDGQQLRERSENQVRERLDNPGIQQRQQNMENIRQQTEGKAKEDVPGAAKRWWWPFGE